MPAGGLYVITGGSTGLGLHAALTLAGQGATVVIAARNEERLAAAVARAEAAGAAAGGSAVGMRLDLSSMADVKRFADELLARFPGQKVTRARPLLGRGGGACLRGPLKAHLCYRALQPCTRRAAAMRMACSPRGVQAIVAPLPRPTLQRFGPF